MKYYSTLQVSKLLGVTKRYVTKLCSDGAIEGAYKKGSRWMIPNNYVNKKIGNTSKSRVFNTTGSCNAEKNYMVDLSHRLLEVRKLVDDGKYFAINRARQYGKTTTIQALAESLRKDYIVVCMDFQMQMSDAKFRNENTFSIAFAKAFENSFSLFCDNQEILQEFTKNRNEAINDFELVELFRALSRLCANSTKKIVLIIDEVDSATNNQVFLDFLAQLRGYYINRKHYPTFQSVILVGVYDVRNLKRKMRAEDEHKDNSPWNIASDFNIDMSFSENEIEAMLQCYADDYNLNLDTKYLSKEIFNYTSGYPYLVSRICQLIDEKDKNWTRSGLLDAIRRLVNETNSLFEDMTKKVKDYPSLKEMIRSILFCGKTIPFNEATELISIGTMFGFLKEVDGQVAIANRIFEIWFYNLFIAQDAIDNKTYNEGQNVKDQFISKENLDVKKILQMFTIHFTQCFADSTDTFVEENGRRLFLLYIRPLINGIGNYYIESRTRSMGRTDLIIDYKNKQYIIEMKIWRGSEYNSRGEKQLVGYLNDYNLQTGYMLSFNFNKNKEIGVKEIHIDGKTLIEAVV